MTAPERAPSESNFDPATVDAFGAEWKKFDFRGRSKEELDQVFEDYFSLFPWSALPKGAEGFDLGCGSGRWAVRVAPRVGRLQCIDASADALSVARNALVDCPNCELHRASVDRLPLQPGTMDFGYSLGVLHHLPDPEAGLRSCVEALKPGAPMLVYLYYALDGRSPAYRALWRLSDIVRRRIAGLPFSARLAASQALAASIYFPLAKAAKWLDAIGFDASQIPLHYYKDRSFYLMRNDALDRFGTRLEHRFSRDQIRGMMQRSGLERISFREGAPYWCAIGYRANPEP